MTAARSRWVTMAAAAALVLAACGGGDTDTEQAGETTPSSTDASAPATDGATAETTDGATAETTDGATAETTDSATASTAPEDEGDPVAGGTFTIAAFTEIAGLDPTKLLSFACCGFQAGQAVYDTLMGIDPETGEIIPKLAESMEPNEDLTSWTLTLRDGLTFHDGTPLDGEAVVTNIARHQDPANASPSGLAVGQVTDMQADGQTVTFTLAQPMASFPVSLAGVAGMIASPTALEEMGEDYNLNPVGAGPFQFVSWEQGNELRMERFDGYYQDGKPYADEWVQRPIPDAQARTAALQSGEADLTYEPFISPVTMSLRDVDGFDVDIDFGNNGGGLVFNMDAEHVSDVRVRKAISHFLDGEGLAAATGGDVLTSTRGIFREDSEWYSGVEYAQFDVAAGQALLQEYLGEAGVDSITLDLLSLPERRQVAELYQALLTQPGLNIEITQIDQAEQPQTVFSGNYELAIWSIPEFVDPDGLYENYHSTSPINGAQMDNPDMDAALERGRSTTDVEERKAAYAEVDQLVADEVPVAFITPSVQVIAQREGLNGVAPFGDQRFYSEDVWIGE